MVEGETGLLRFMYLTNFLTSVTFGTAIYLLPVFAEGLGASYIDLGIIGAVGNAFYTISTLVSGFLLDRLERVRFYMAFSILGSMVVLAFSATTRVSEVVVVRGFLGLASAAFWVAASTLISDMSPPELLTQSIGRYNLSWIVAFIAGPFLGGIISDACGFPALFVLLFALGIVSFVVILRRLHPRVKSWNRDRSKGFDLSALRGLQLAYFALVPYAVVLGVYMAILPGHMKGLGIPGSMVGLLLTVSNGFRGLGFFSAKRFVSWGAGRSLFVASILMCVALSMVVYSVDALGFFLPLAMYGLAGGIVTPVILDYIAYRTPSDALGTAMGVHEAIYGFGMCVGPVAGGFIADAFSPSTLYVSLAFLSLFMLPFSRALAKEQSRRGG